MRSCPNGGMSLSMKISWMFLAVALTPFTCLFAEWEIAPAKEVKSGLYVKQEPAVVRATWKGNEPTAALPKCGIFDFQGKKIADLIFESGAGSSFSAKLPTDRQGYFEVRPLSGNAEALIPRAGSRPAGKLTYAVVSALDTIASDHGRYQFLSIQGSTRTFQRDGVDYPWGIYPYLGIQGFQIGYQWPHLQPNGPADDIDAYLAKDRLPKWVKEANYFPFFNLTSFPGWAVDAARVPAKYKTSAHWATGRIPPKDLAAYEQYLRKTVGHIAKEYSQLPYREYEIMWEPSAPWGWWGTDSELVQVYAMAHRIIHEIDPQGRVAGPTGVSLDRFKILMDAGLWKYLDVIAQHPYTSYPPEKGGIPQIVSQHIETMRQYSGRTVPFLGSEFGYPLSQCEGSELNQAYAMVNALLLFKAEGAQTHTLFYLSDYPGEPGYGLMYNLDLEKIAYGPANVSPRPVFPMIRAAMDEIGRAKLVGNIDYLGADIFGYVYADGKSLIGVIWDATGTDRTISLDSGATTVEVGDCFDNRTALKTEGGKIPLKLSRSPLYVRGLSSQLFSADQMKSAIDTSKVWKVFRGQTMNQPLSFGRDLAQKEVTLTFDTTSTISRDQFRKKLIPTKGTSETVSLPISSQAPFGRSVGYLRLNDDQGTIYRTLQRIEVVPEITVISAKPKLENGQWTLAVAVQNELPLKWRGSSQLTMLGTAGVSLPLQLDPKGVNQLQIPISSNAIDPLQSVQLSLNFVSDTGSVVTKETSLSFFPIQKSKMNVTDKNPWSAIRLIPWNVNSAGTNFKAQYGLGKEKADISAQIGVAYDANNLYVQVIANDAAHRNIAEPSATWSQDSLQLSLDMCPDRVRTGNLVAEQFERTDCALTFAFTAERGPEVFIDQAPGGGGLSNFQILKDTAVRLDGGRIEDKKQTVYRIVLPWSFIDPKKVRQEDGIGIAAVLNDSDQEQKPPDRRGLLLFDGIMTGKNPGLYGRATFER